ncbi:hypothetical protein [Halorubellus sp. PRR65]|uniref:hypothetical protein n=1 Tax=Halorubellus sp. PRR65 TaxID=3098148 RepID=UPI002B25F042|nr:hypothetical protein [Halorubellus sp. PRR65]
MRRRTLLAALAATTAGTAATAGCLGALPGDDSTAGGPTTIGSDATAEASGTATTEPCTVEDSLGVVDVDVPEDPTPGAARSLAEFVEETVARDRADAEGWNVGGVEYVRSETADDQPEDGAYAYAEVSLDAVESAERADGTATTLVASLHYDAWYRVTATRVERAPAYDDGAPPEDGWTTIACA